MVKTRRLFKNIVICLFVCTRICLASVPKDAYALTVRHDTDETIEFFTPVASNVDVNSLVSVGDRAGDITHDGIITYVTFNPCNTFEQISARGYGLRDYMKSLSGKDLLKPIYDRISARTYLGNVVVLDFDVWEDLTGNGLSSDDLFYGAGTEIPVGTSRRFYITCATSSGNHRVAFGSYGINAAEGQIFYYTPSAIRILDSGLTGNHVNSKEQYTAYSAAQYKVKSRVTGAGIVYASGFYEDTLPRQEVALKRGYPVAISAETFGSFAGSGYVEFKPHFSWVDEDFNNEQKDVKLFYDTYISGSRALLVEVGQDLDNGNVKSITAHDGRLRIPSAVYNLRGQLKPITSNTVVSTYTYGGSVTGECFFKACNRAALPASRDGTENFAKKIEMGQQTWYSLFVLPSDIALVKKGSEYYDMADDLRLADYIYGRNGFSRDGYVKVTFDIVAHDNAGEAVTLSSADNGLVLYYDLDKCVGDDMVIKGLYRY